MPIAPPAKEPESASAQKPVKVFRLRGVSASVFANRAEIDGKERTFHKVSVQRSFKDGDEWKQNSSFGRDDLPVLGLMLNRAWEFILDTESARNKEEAGE
jgi:hypothetical protein